MTSQDLVDNQKEAPFQKPLRHPHMRGEKPVANPRWMACPGPPPHAWGQYPPLQLGEALLRSTPTCVGNKSAGADTGWPPAVHPHMRGEQVKVRRRETNILP
jgi:hypothetical protein